LLMVFSMVIAQSLVARTFGTYTLQLFDIGPQSNLVPVLGVGLLIFTYIVNISEKKLFRHLPLAFLYLKSQVSWFFHWLLFGRQIFQLKAYLVGLSQIR